MIVIFGTKNVSHTVQQGTFDCPRCGTIRQYHLNQNRRFFSLFFIPLIPMNKEPDTLQCTFCKTNYIPNSVIAGLSESHFPPVLEGIDAPLASAGKRFMGFFLDIVLLTLLNFPLAYAADYVPAYFNGKFQIVFLSVWFLYFFLMEVFFCSTVGKKIVSIETRSDGDGGKIPAVRLFIRSLVKMIPLVNIILLFNDKRKACHDFAANTIVVETKQMVKRQHF